MILGPKEVNWGPVRPPAKAQEQLQPNYMYITTLFGGHLDITIGFSIKFWSTGQNLRAIRVSIFSKQFTALYGWYQPVFSNDLRVQKGL